MLPTRSTSRVFRHAFFSNSRAILSPLADVPVASLLYEEVSDARLEPSSYIQNDRNRQHEFVVT